MKFLIDMNLSPLWVAFLADQGFEAVHWSTIGPPEAADTEIFDFAAAKGWIVFTHDLDFGILLAALEPIDPASFRFGRRTFSRLPLAISCFGLFGQPKLISKPAPSLPWTPSAIAFASCRSEK